MLKPVKDFVKGRSITIQVNYTNGTNLNGSTFILAFTNNINDSNATKSFNTNVTTSTNTVDIELTSTFTNTLEPGEYIVECTRVDTEGVPTTVFRSGINDVDTVNIFSNI